MQGKRDIWRVRAQSISPAGATGWSEAIRLLQEIVADTESSSLRELAKQALPSLQAASQHKAHTYWRDVGGHRFDAVRHELNRKATRQFGKRLGQVSEFADPLNGAQTDTDFRTLLGLSGTGRLFGPEIRDAFRRAARSAHPDAGGDSLGFIRLVVARDALLSKL